MDRESIANKEFRGRGVINIIANCDHNSNMEIRYEQ